MDFFRKYQRLILYTAGIFALVSFSISPAILGFFQSWFAGSVPTPTMNVGGEIVRVTPEDERIGIELTRRHGQSFIYGGGAFAAQDPAVVIPPVHDPRGETKVTDIYAALRRLAIHAGIEVSDSEVDKAIEQALQVTPESINTPEALARHNQYPSVNEYRRVLREALRIGWFVRLHALVPEAMDHAVVQELVENLETVTLQVASLDAKQLQESLESEDVTDEALQEWIAGLEQAEQQQLGYLDRDRFRLEILDADLSTFDPEQWSEQLGEYAVSDEQVQQFYDTRKAMLFRVDPPKEEREDGDEKPGDEEESTEPPKDGEQDQTPKDGEQDQTPKEGEGEQEQAPQDGEGEQTPEDEPAEDEPAEEEPQEPQFVELDDTLRADIRRRLLAEEVLRKLWQQIRERVEESASAELDALKAAQEALDTAQKAAEEARVAADASDATDEDRQALEAAEEAVTQQQEAVDAAQEAVAQKRASFDLRAAVADLAGDRAGLSVVETEGLKNVDALRELPGIGVWEQSWAASALREAGTMSTQVQHVPGHAFEFRVVEVETSPLKEFDEIREKARADYFTKKADELAEEKKEAFEEALLEQARQRIPERITELETERDQKLEERMTEWRTGLETRITETRELAQRLEAEDPASRAYASARDRLTRLEGELAGAEAKREEIRTELQEEADTSIEEAAREEFCAVLASVAENNGFTLTEVGPYPRDLQSRGGPRERFPEAVQFLFWNPAITDPEEGVGEGQSTEVLHDPTNRRYYVACATDVEEATLADLTRRQLVMARQQIGPSRRVEALMYSFSLDALRQRYDYKLPGETVTKPADNDQ